MKTSLIFPLDNLEQNAHIYSAMAKKKPEPMKRITWVPDEVETARIRAGMEKYGLRKAVDLLRIALRKLSDSEGLEPRAS